MTPPVRLLLLGGALPFLDGIICALSFPPYSIGAAALVAGSLTLFTLRRLPLRAAFPAALLFGVTSSVAVAPWVYTAMHEHYHFGVLASLLFNVFVVGFGVGIYLGIPLFIWRILARRVTDPEPAWMRGRGGAVRPLLAASLFVIFGWLRTHGPLSMPWGLFGYGFGSLHVLSQSADLFGVLGLCFLSMLSAGFFSEALEHYITASREGVPLWAACRKPLLALVAVVGAFLLYGSARLVMVKKEFVHLEETASPVKVALVQANIPQGDRWNADLVPRNMGKHIDLSKKVIEEKSPALVIWPETAMNTYITGEDSEYRRRIHQTAYEHQVDFLLGGPHSEFGKDGNPHYFNSIFHISPTGLGQDRYDKIELLAFAEYNPFSNASFLPKPKEVPRDYTPGGAPQIFSVGDLKIGPLICFEALYPWLSRDLVHRGANILLNISNDAWFLKTKAAAQHIDQARFAAIALRRYLIRNAGTGISAVVDPLGDYVGEPLPIFTEGILVEEVRPLNLSSPYAFWGDWPLLLTCLLISCGGIGLALRERFLGEEAL